MYRGFRQLTQEAVYVSVKTDYKVVGLFIHISFKIPYLWTSLPIFYVKINNNDPETAKLVHRHYTYCSRTINQQFSHNFPVTTT